MTLTHTPRYHAAHGTTGIGHLYQGRYKSFPVQDESYYLTVMRYIEANPLRAEIVTEAQDWPWSSIALRLGRKAVIDLSDGPVELPPDWRRLVQEVIEEEDMNHLINSIKRGTPLGESNWAYDTANLMHLETTMNPRGRPKKGTGHL